MAGVARHEFARALEIGGTEDHLHALLSLRGNVAPADALRKWKSLSSGWVHQMFTTQCAFAWQAGHAAFSVSQSAIDAVRAYIAGQVEHHRRVSFDEELRMFLDRNGVPYDPAHLVD